MFLSPLVDQLIRSLNKEPLRWSRRARFMRRDDGTTIQFIQSYSSRTTRPQLKLPREVAFNWIESRLLLRAIKRWLHRPI
jgi:hypothetical protein